MSATNGTSPSHAELNSLLEHYQHGRYEDAESLAISITQQYPNHQFGWKALGAVLKQTGRISEALVANQKAVKLAPDDAEAHSNLGVTLKELGRLEESEANCRHAIALEPDYAEAHNNLGNALRELGKLEVAEASYGQAIALKPEFAEAHYNLGVTLKALGRLEEAEASYRIVIALKPDYAEAHRNLALIYRYKNEDKQFLQMQKLYLDQTLADEHRVHLSFALAKAYEDIDQIGNSFKHYSEGNALQKKLLNYDISKDVEIFEQITKTHPTIEKVPVGISMLSNNIKPIFIVGMPRSGTSLVEQIITSHSEVTGAGELPFVEILGDSIARGISQLDTEVLLNFSKIYRSKLQLFSNESQIVTDKMPQNFRYIGLLTSAFPDAKIVHVKRNSAAVCWGNYKQFFVSKSLGYCYELSDVVRYYALYQNLMKFWELRCGNRIYNLDYELLTINQEDETKKLIQYLGLDWENECLAPQDNMRSVSTASNMQVRQKIYQGSSHGWKKFKPFLNGVLDHLEA